MNRLKPCPFCGGEDIYLLHRGSSYGIDVPIIFCSHCKVWIEPEDDSASDNNDETYNHLLKRVTNVWNERTEE